MRFRVRPVWLVLLLACGGGPQSGTEVGNPAFACGASASDAGGAGGDGGYPACDPRGVLSFRCGDEAACELVDFGEVVVGATGRVTVTVRNDGCDFQSFPAPALDGPVVLLEGPSWPAHLAPGQQVSLVLGFTPTAAGPTDGDVRFAFTPAGERLLPWIGTGR